MLSLKSLSLKSINNYNWFAIVIYNIMFNTLVCSTPELGKNMIIKAENSRLYVFYCWHAPNEYIGLHTEISIVIKYNYLI